MRAYQGIPVEKHIPGELQNVKSVGIIHIDRNNHISFFGAFQQAGGTVSHILRRILGKLVIWDMGNAQPTFGNQDDSDCNQNEAY